MISKSDETFFDLSIGRDAFTDADGDISLNYSIERVGSQLVLKTPEDDNFEEEIWDKKRFQKECKIIRYSEILRKFKDKNGISLGEDSKFKDFDGEEDITENWNIGVHNNELVLVIPEDEDYEESYINSNEFSKKYIIVTEESGIKEMFRELQIFSDELELRKKEYNKFYNKVSKDLNFKLAKGLIKNSFAKKFLKQLDILKKNK